MEWLASLQRWLHGNALDALKALQADGMTALPGLLGAAFVFGLLHALLPGHGKAALTVHHVGRGGLASAITSSVIVIVTHVGLAIGLVLTGATILRRTLGQAGRAPELEIMSHGLVTLVGIWLLWHAIRHRHDADPDTEHRSGVFLAIAAGAIPCPLTTFIMTWAVLNGAIAAGLILSGAFAAGMITTVMFFPLVAVFSRGQLSRLSDDARTLGSRIGHALGIFAALAVIFIGAWPLVKT